MFGQPVVDIINDWLHSLPRELIRSTKKVTQKDFFRMYKYGGDPSEAIRSGDLQGQLLENFNLIESTSFGGSLLLPFFLTANLRPVRLKVSNWHNTEIGKSESARLVNLEREIIDSGKIEPNYMYYVFGKKEKRKQ
jgi:hypothetical protein